jgi:thiamine biosynthesis lipoprotein
MSRRTFQAMGVKIVVGGAGEESWESVRDLVLDWDGIFSRFIPGSELNRVNTSGEEVVVVSETFAQVVRVALSAARTTRGLVDPTLSAALEAAGYDRDFAQLDTDPRPLGPPTRGSWSDLSLYGRLLSRPVGTVLDLNGVVKGVVVDRALALLPAPSFVAAGGDVAASGDVVVGLPAGGSVRLESGGLATTGTTYRRWSRGGSVQHHLIDPRTGGPALSRWDEVTVAASTCLAADIAAKAAFLLSDEGLDWLDERGLPGRFIDGPRVVENDGWNRACSADRIAA